MDKITIVDVAKMAGVSKGTVDRVLHSRGEVSKKSAERVKAAIEQLGYEPNLHASLLATRRRLSIACLLPSSDEGEYWDMVRQGCIKGGEEVSALGVELQLFFYDQYDVESFRAAGEQMLESDPIGVVLPPFFKNDTLAIAQRLSQRHIPYVYIDSRIEDSGYLAYFGMPSYKSGRLVAALLTERCSTEQVDDILCVRVKRDKTGLSDPTIDRRLGFNDYINQYFPEARIHSLFIDPHDEREIEARLDAFFAEHPAVKYVVTFNSRVHLIAEYLRQHPLEGRRVIGYDDLERNVAALRMGAVTILIRQDIVAYTAHAVSALVDYTLMHKAPQVKDDYVHMDILTRFNI